MTSAEPAAGITRGRLLLAAGAAAAGALAIGSRRGDGGPLAAPRGDDAGILAFFLTLEQVQEDFYRRAVEAGGIDGELRELATTVGGQEREHARLLHARLDAGTPPRPRTDFDDDAVGSPEAFLRTAIALEEAAIAGYVGQAGNLGREQIGSIARLVSVEARQVAWLRDLAGVSPAPRAADPARKAGEVLDELRSKGWLA
jgi:rubrerythrin